MRPFLIIEEPNAKCFISIYDDGRVYGSESRQLYGILNKEAMKDISNLISRNMYMFKKLIDFDLGSNPLILHVRDDSKKHRKIKIKGWSQIQELISIIHKAENFINNSN